jgi:hypothetical protein
MNPEKTYVGKPCKRGHDGLRWRASGACIECQRTYQRTAPRIARKITFEEWQARKQDFESWSIKRNQRSPSQLTT